MEVAEINTPGGHFAFVVHMMAVAEIKIGFCLIPSANMRIQRERGIEDNMMRKDDTMS